MVATLVFVCPYEPGLIILRACSFYGYLILTKKPEMHAEEKKASLANGTGQPRWLHLKNANRSIFITLCNTN